MRGTKKTADKLRFIPLGGLGEVGKNMYAIEYGDDIIVIDSGLKFADQDMLGIDFIVPDISYLEKNREKILGIILTHGHEDHIGGLLFVLPKLNVPIYGTPLTLGLVLQKFYDEMPTFSPVLNRVNAGEIIDIGPFKVRFMAVTHSIPDGVGLSIETPAGRIVHTGDFKLDSTPIDGRLTDYAAFAEEGKKGVLLFLSDSTNAERKGFTPSESTISTILERVFRHYRSRRIVISAFASNLHRVQQIVDVSAHFNRKIAFLGRSMVRNTELATELGYLEIDKRMIAREDEIPNLPDNQLVIATTGSQGEPFSGLVLMSKGEHKSVKLCNHDVVLLLASAIPGNEKLVNKTINRLFTMGCEVVYEEHEKVHVSGHASSEELKLMLNIVKPKYFVPIHGESRHLYRHAQLANEVGIPNKNIFIMENGDVLTLGNKASVREKVTAGALMINGNTFDTVQPSVMKQRIALGEEGVVVVSATLDEKLRPVAPISIVCRGFLLCDEEEEFVKEARGAIEKLLSKEKKSDAEALSQKFKMCLREHIRKRNNTYPVILPVISFCTSNANIKYKNPHAE